MSREIVSPSKRWPGKVTVADPMTLPQAEAFEAGLSLPDDAKEKGGNVFLSVVDKTQLPTILACVEKWELGNFPESPSLETWPFSPRRESHQLIAWLFDEIRKVYLGELEVPNA